MLGRPPDGRHHSFGAGAYKAQFFDKLIVFEDKRGKFIIQRSRRTERHAMLHHFDHLFAYLLMVMAMVQRPPRTAKIYKLIPVGVPQVTAFALFDKERRSVY